MRFQFRHCQRPFYTAHNSVVRQQTPY